MGLMALLEANGINFAITEEKSTSTRAEETIAIYYERYYSEIQVKKPLEELLL